MSTGMAKEPSYFEHVTVGDFITVNRRGGSDRYEVIKVTAKKFTARHENMGWLCTFRKSDGRSTSSSKFSQIIWAEPTSCHKYAADRSAP